ncbi:MAG: bifunctional DNA primase/polymerase [Chloroflexota bacterium]
MVDTVSVGKRLSSREGELLEAALAYASRGWPVFPLHVPRPDGGCSCNQSDCKRQGKHPQTLHGHREATTDPEVVRRWWTGLFPGSNIGLCTGSVSGLVVLDVDADKDGEESLAELERDHEKLPATVESLTGGGGRHIFFGHPGGTLKCTVAKLGAGLDVRADGGYIVAPPSLHASGRQYIWEASSHPDEVPLAPLPSWLQENMSGRDDRRLPAGLVAERIPEGERNSTLTSLAGSMRHRGMGEQAIREALLAENEEKCDPPLGENEVASIASSVARYEPGSPATDQPQGVVGRRMGDGRGAKEAQADQLVKLAMGKASEFFTDQYGKPYALVEGEALPLGKKGGKWLRKLFYETLGKAPSGEAVSTALDQLVAQAEFAGAQRTLELRAAKVDGAIFYDLGPRRCVRIDADGFEKVPTPPGLFRRYSGQQGQPDPAGQGGPECRKALLGLLPLAEEYQRRLFVAYLVTALDPTVARPILLTTGPMGSGKSTVHRVVKRLLDPQEPESIRLDGEATQKAAHHYVVMLDNVSRLSGADADMLCRWVTGEADSKRQLYTDDEDVIYAFKRLVLVNGISIPSDRPDLLDRAVVFTLRRISPERRVEETAIWTQLEEMRADLLADLFGLLSKALAVRPTVHLERKPRLADWGMLAAAVYEAIGLGAGQFEKDWALIVQSQQASSLDSVLVTLLHNLVDCRGPWSGTTSSLYQALQEMADLANIQLRGDGSWPKTPSWLGRRLKELLPVLEDNGMIVADSSSGEGTVWDIRWRRG